MAGSVRWGAQHCKRPPVLAVRTMLLGPRDTRVCAAMSSISTGSPALPAGRSHQCQSTHRGHDSSPAETRPPSESLGPQPLSDPPNSPPPVQGAAGDGPAVQCDIWESTLIRSGSETLLCQPKPWPSLNGLRGALDRLPTGRSALLWCDTLRQHISHLAAERCHSSTINGHISALRMVGKLALIPLTVAPIHYFTPKMFQWLYLDCFCKSVCCPVGTAIPNFEEKRHFWMALGVLTCRGGFGCISFVHTHTRARALACLGSPRQAKPRHGLHGMAWFGMACSPYYLMCPSERNLLQNCFMGYARIFVVKVCVVHGKAMVQKKGIARPNFEEKRRFWMALGVSACVGGFGCI